MIQIITYAVPHRKTQDTLISLKYLGYDDVEVLAIPWVERKKSSTPLIPHRPWEPKKISPDIFVTNLGYTYTVVDTDLLHTALDKDAEAILLCGAGILPESIVSEVSIINAHPAYLPYVRGLDALKWAIYYNKPVGVTTHIIDLEVDAGILIRREKIPLYEWDTFHSFALRQYEKEIEMLVGSIQDIKNNVPSFLLEITSSPVYKRMPREKEMELLNLFEKRKSDVFCDTCINI